MAVHPSGARLFCTRARSGVDWAHMRRFLPLLAALALAGCSGLTGSVNEPGAPIRTKEPTMLACRYDDDTCMRVSVISDGTTVERMRDDIGDWVMVVESECFDGYCHVVDEFGTEWKLEP